MKTIIFSLVFCLLPYVTMSMSPFELKKNDEELREKLLRKFKRLECYNKLGQYGIVIINRLQLVNETKSIFTNDLLLENLEYQYRGRRSRIPWVQYNIYEHSDGVKWIAGGDNHFNQIICRSNDIGNELLDFLYNNEFEFCFIIHQISSAHFGIKNGIIYVIPLVSPKSFQQEYRMYPLDEYVRDHWDDLYEGSFNPFYKK